MKEATILYRPGTGEVIWGIPLDTKIVDAREVEEHLDDGWYRHPFEARDAAEAAKDAQLSEPAQNPAEPEPEPVVGEALSLADQAAALGIKIDGRWSDERLAKEIKEAKAAKAAE